MTTSTARGQGLPRRERAGLDLTAGKQRSPRPDRSTLGRAALGLAAASVFLTPVVQSGCGPSASSTVQNKNAANTGGAPVRVRSFSDSRPVSCLAAASGIVWVGTPRGLIRWTTTSDPPTPAVLTTIDGLPADKITALALDAKGGVWVTTPKGVARYVGGSWTSYPKPPVGDLVAGIVGTADGEGAWVGGSDGIARLKDGNWERFAAGTSITSLQSDGGSGVWIGTAGKGVMRIVKDDLLQYGMAEGNDIDNVRAMVADNSGTLLAVGDGPGGQRAAYFDGGRFYSYRVEAPSVMEWVQRVGAELYLGSGQSVWSMKRVASGSRLSGPVKFTFTGTAALGAPKAQPLKGLQVQDAAPAAKPAPAGAAPAGAAPAAPAAPPAKAEEPAGKGKEKKVKEKKGKKSAQLTVPAEVMQKLARSAASPSHPGQAEAEHAARQWLVAGPGGSGGTPVFDTELVDLRLPDGVTTVSADNESLYVGTRFLGVMRVSKGRLAPLRLFDLTAGAERLSVGCVNNNDCYVATGGTQAWRFDGQSFELSEVDPEKGSHVLAVVRDPSGAVIALHRGASNKGVRISRVGGQGQWSPVGVTSLEVPSGVPDLSFATYSPKGQLWVGLRYVDKDQDARAFGAAEVWVDDGRVIYHRQRPAGVARSASEGVNVPIDVTSVAFKSGDEVWLASRSGAVRLQNNKTKTFTENDGLESELVHDVVEGLNGQMWIATSRGIGQWNGERWSFPKEYPFNAKASALVRDPDGRVWIGTDKGVIEVLSDKAYHLISTRTGLLDEKVLNMGVDVRGRIWVLTEKGISVVEPL